MLAVRNLVTVPIPWPGMGVMGTVTSFEQQLIELMSNRDFCFQARLARTVYTIPKNVQVQVEFKNNPPGIRIRGQGILASSVEIQSVPPCVIYAGWDNEQNSKLFDFEVKMSRYVNHVQQDLFPYCGGKIEFFSQFACARKSC